MIQAVDFGLLPVLRFMEDTRMNVIDINEIKNEVQKTICFTGHRPNKLAGYTNRVPYTVFVKNLKEMLIPLVEQGYIRFITGGAQGIDQLAFWTVEGLKAAGYAGLEFDNVILLYNEHDSATEEAKRMYYVGLTRARQSEYILAYNAHKQSSNIMAAYEAICASKSASDSSSALGDTNITENEMGETA